MASKTIRLSVGAIFSKGPGKIYFYRYQVDGHRKTVSLQTANRAEALRKAEEFIPIIKGRKYTNGGNGEVCHVCNGFGVIHESSDSLYKNPPQYSKPSSDFDSPIIKGGCGFILGLILLCAIVGSCDAKKEENPYEKAEKLERQIEIETGLKTKIYPTENGKFRMHFVK